MISYRRWRWIAISFVTRCALFCSLRVRGERVEVAESIAGRRQARTWENSRLIARRGGCGSGRVKLRTGFLPELWVFGKVFARPRLSRGLQAGPSAPPPSELHLSGRKLSNPGSVEDSARKHCPDHMAPSPKT